MQARARLRLGLPVCALGVALALALGGPASAEGSSIHVFGSSFGGASTTVPDPYPLGAPSDVAIDESASGSHDVYVTDPAHSRIEKFDPSGQLILMFGKEVNRTKVEASATEAEQNICTVGSGDTCQSGTEGEEGGGEFSDPRFVAVDSSTSVSSGNVYVGDAGTDTLYKFGPGGGFISAEDGSAAPQGPFASIDALTVDGGGNVWVFDLRGFAYRFAADGSLVAPVLETPDGGEPGGIAVEGTGDFFAVGGFGSLEKYGSVGQLIGEVTPRPNEPGGRQVSGVALGRPAEDLYVDFGDEVGHIPPGCEPPRRPATNFCELADSFGFPELLSGAGIAADDGDGAVLVADEGAGSADRFPVGLEAITGSADELTAHQASVHASVNPEGADVTECGFEYGPSREYGQSSPCLETPVSGASPVAVHAHLQGLEGGTTYHYRVFAKNSAGVLRAEDGTFETSPTASIEAVAARNITATSAELVARIDPNGLDTHYRFEYGTGLGYGTSVPIPDQDIGAGTSDVEVSQAIGGLQPNTTYHFRVVATDADGVAESSDHTFVFLSSAPAVCANEALRGGLSANLPDCRGYELVTPAQKNSALIGAVLFGPSFPAIAEDGAHLIVPSVQCFAAAQSCVAHRSSEGELYEFSRASGTWQTSPLAPSASQFQTESFLAFGANPNSYLFSTPGPGAEDFYARMPDGTYHLIGPIGEGEDDLNLLLGGIASSADFSHLVYGTKLPVWAFDHGERGENGEGEAHSIYEYANAGSAAPSLVGVSGGQGSTDLISTCRTGLGGITISPANTYNPLSADGRIVYFTAGQCATGSGANAGMEVPADSLYERIDQSRTVPVSAALAASCTTPECEGSTASAAVFEGASRDGERVLFTSTQQLTDGASQDRQKGDSATVGAQNGCGRTAPSASGCNLYLAECPAHCEDPSQRKLIDLSEGAKDGGGPKVQGVVAMSPDGGSVFFVARGVLTTAKNKLGEGAQTGADNLYLYERDEAHPQGRLTFVARLSAEDLPDWAGGAVFEGPGATVSAQGQGLANITPDGRYLVFTSTRALTADASPGPAQVYRYDAQDEEMVRLSVGQDGFNDNGNAGRPGADASIVPADRAYILGNGPAHANPTMSDDGSYVFFQSPVGLTPAALNEAPVGSTSELALNVYEYHDGTVSLISDGKDRSESGRIPARSPELLGTDAGGENVFFATNSQLTAKDTDTQRDYYDARVGGGEEAPVLVPPCAGDACRGVTSAAAPVGLPGTTQTGPDGNLTPQTRAQQLREALKSCRRKFKNGSRRAACERGARRRFSAQAKPERHAPKRSPKGGGR
jgi:WD40-like Beta Propeller Repeat